MPPASIALSGPLGYERQYEAGLVIALQRWEALDRLAVEPANGEDLEIEIGGVTFEIQSKSTAREVDADALADVLLHFPDRQDSGSLLERLLRDDHRRAVAACGGRALDAVAPLVRRVADALDPATSKVPKETLSAMRSALASAAARLLANDPKSIDHRRGVASTALLAKLNPAQLRAALTRVAVLEHIADSDSQHRLDVALHRHADVPPSKTRACAHALLDLLRGARGQGAGFLHPARDLTFGWGCGAALPAADVHVPRPDESELFDALELDHALLLAGESGSGKSQDARRMVDRLRRIGFAWREAATPEEAAAYLRERVNEDRVVLLQDPLGAIEPVVDAPARCRALRDLLGQRGSHRRVVVTSQTAILLRVLGRTRLDACRVDRLAWHDRTLTDVTLATAIWAAPAAARGYRPPSLIESRD